MPAVADAHTDVLERAQMRLEVLWLELVASRERTREADGVAL
jgi:predicted outer membrane lipoprotein